MDDNAAPSSDGSDDAVFVDAVGSEDASDAFDDWDDDDAAWAALAPAEGAAAEDPRSFSPPPPPPDATPPPPLPPAPLPAAVRRARSGASPPTPRRSSLRDSKDSVRLALAGRRVADVGAASARVARGVAAAAASSGSLEPYAALEAALAGLRGALVGARAATSSYADAAAPPRSLNELERDLRGLGGRLLEGEAIDEAALDALDAAVKAHPEHAARRRERDALWDARRAASFGSNPQRLRVDDRRASRPPPAGARARRQRRRAQPPAAVRAARRRRRDGRAAAARVRAGAGNGGLQHTFNANV